MMPHMVSHCSQSLHSSRCCAEQQASWLGFSKSHLTLRKRMGEEGDGELGGRGAQKPKVGVQNL